MSVETKTTTHAFHYSGRELDLFGTATHWKGYVKSALAPYLVGHVLEIGAGMGGSTVALCSDRQESWTALEPDANLCAELQARIKQAKLPVSIEVKTGSLSDLDATTRFSCILYLDVLEHIKDDAAELAAAAQHLAPGGALVVVAPAHPWLFTEFDRAIGHFRRYTARTLARLTPAGLELARLEYLDSVGLFASLANRVALRTATPTARQVGFWDNFMVPISRRVDPLLFYRVGKSILSVWRKA